MNTTMSQTINTWAAHHPETLTFLDALNENNITWGMYCGSATEFLTGNRNSSDIDIVIKTSDFAAVFALAPRDAIINNDPTATVACGDGLILDFPRRSICFWLDGQEIEIMASTTASYGRRRYHLAMSDFSIKHRLLFEMGKTQLYVSHPFDTIALKSVLQRGHTMNKHDAEDIASLERSFPTDVSYAQKRAMEVQLGARELDFLAMCNVDITTSVQTAPSYGILYAY